MSGKSSKTQVFSIRLRNETVEKIKQALKSPNNKDTSVNDYCKNVIERYAWRHDND